MEPGLIWVLAGALLLAGELALPGVMLLWVGLAALVTGGALLLTPLSTAETLVIFAAAFGAGLLLAGQLGGWGGRTGEGAAGVNTPESGLVGRSGLLTPAPDGGGGAGLRVRIGDSDWPARLPRDQRVPEGPMRVRVEGVDGTTLLVRPE